MAAFDVQRHPWRRWPRVLVMERTDDDGGREERRYVPDGGTRDEWNERLRGYMRKYSEASEKLEARLLEEQEAPGLRAEIDGLKWAIEERDALLRDMWRELDMLDSELETVPMMRKGIGLNRIRERYGALGLGE